MISDTPIALSRDDQTTNIIPKEEGYLVRVLDALPGSVDRFSEIRSLKFKLSEEPLSVTGNFLCHLLDQDACFLRMWDEDYLAFCSLRSNLLVSVSILSLMCQAGSPCCGCVWLLPSKAPGEM